MSRRRRGETRKMNVSPSLLYQLFMAPERAGRAFKDSKKKKNPPEVFSLYTTTPVKSGVESQLYINALHHNASINKNGERYQIAVV